MQQKLHLHVSLRDWDNQLNLASASVTANTKAHEHQDSNFKRGGLVGPHRIS